MDCGCGSGAAHHAAPGTMPGDARVDFVYRPTYYAVAIMIKAAMRYPELYPEFTELYRETLSYIEERVANGALAGAWGDDHTAAGMAILRRNGIM